MHRILAYSKICYRNFARRVGSIRLQIPGKHWRTKQILEKLYPSSLQGIITIPDPKKGEQLIFVSSNEDVNLKDIQNYFKQQKISDLWIPKKVIYMKKVPILGTGKFDYQTTKKIILEGDF